MLPRPLRLTRRGFETARGLRRAHSPHFSLSYGEAREAGGGSAVIVPKKAVRGAVSRYLLKRRVRGILLPFSSPSRILIVSARKESEQLPYAELERELSGLLRSILKEQNT